MNLPDHVRLSLYQEMLRIRRVEERIAKLYPEQGIRCPVHLCVGSEAVVVGTCSLLKKTDVVFCGHRSHGVYLAKGGSLKKLFAELYGREGGCSRGYGGSMHLIDTSVGFMGSTPIVGSTIPIAVGYAASRKMLGDTSVTAVFFGDGACETGAFFESLNLASLWKLPIIFVCENNGFSVNSSLDVRQSWGIDSKAKSFGIPVWNSDGVRVQSVLRCFRRARQEIVDYGGPSFILLPVERLCEHCGPRIDLPDNLTDGLEADPVFLMRHSLKKDGLLSEKEEDGMEQNIKWEIDVAVAFAQAGPFAGERV